MSGILQVLLAGGGGSSWSTTDKSANIALSNANLTATVSSTGGLVRGTTSHSVGKWYFELLVVASTGGGNNSYVGVDNISPATSSTSIGASDANGGSLKWAAAGSPFVHLIANSGGTNISGGSSPTVGQYIGVAVDVPNHLIYWSINGTYQNSADPVAGTGGVDYVTTSAVFPAFASESGATTSITLNVGATPFNTSAPSGFTAWG